MKIIILAIIALQSYQLLSCDDVLKKFPEDCELQDRFSEVRNIFREHNRNISDVGEYKAIRFIDRNSWEKNANGQQKPINLIYNPAPATWNVWSQGIDSIFTSENLKNNLQNNLNSSLFLSKSEMSHINKILLTNGFISIKDPSTGSISSAGKMRTSFNTSVGFCWGESYSFIQNSIQNSNNSIKDFEARWEKSSGISIRKAIESVSGKKEKGATLVVDLIIGSNSCNNGQGNFVYYISSRKVEKSIDWVRNFLKYNLKQFQKGTPAISPIELAAVVQKWFVSIHPFADGNGRTSRAIQDLILSHFDLPFAPGGDLQDDSLARSDDYVRNSYAAMRDMVTFLEYCANDLQKGKELTYRCKSTKEINN